MKSFFVISLDFELYWGVHDRPEGHFENLEGARNAVAKMLNAFEARAIHATWATVGLLFADDVEEARQASPTNTPRYVRSKYSAYRHLAKNELSHLKFAPNIIQTIANTPGQEIGTHTFSHYYCNEPGQNSDEFAEDLEAACSIAKRKGYTIESLVFPRNQCRAGYLSELRRCGIRSYRGNPNSSLYRARKNEDESPVRRAVRLADSYANLSGFHTYSLEERAVEAPYNFSASAFLRPYSSKSAVLNEYKLRRILAGIDHAAQRGEVYHLWWHPHNFGKNLEQNMDFLLRILDHVQDVRERFNMASMTMRELSDEADKLRNAHR